jgi:hypothetical protein
MAWRGVNEDGVRFSCPPKWYSKSNPAAIPTASDYHLGLPFSLTQLTAVVPAARPLAKQAVRR